MRGTRLLWVAALFLLDAAQARSDILVSLNPASQRGAPGQILTFNATITNTGTDTVYLNGMGISGIGQGFNVNGSPFSSNAPASLVGGDSCTVDIFTVAIDPTMTAGALSGSVKIIGGPDPSATNVLATQYFLAGLVDNTPPSTAIFLSGPLGTNGWYKGAVTVTLTPSDPDGLADVTATYYTVDGSEPQSYTGPFTISGDLVHSITFWSLDRAGNEEVPHKSSTVKIDGTPPALVWGAPAPAPNAAGWNNAAVDISFTTSDNLSGVASAEPDCPVHFDKEGAGQTQTVTVTDSAGNTATFTSPAVSIDMTPPTVTASASPAVLWPPNGKMVPVVISGQMQDALSGVDPTTATFSVVDEYGSVQPAGRITVNPDGTYSVTILLEASRKGGDKAGRHYTIVVNCSDLAGNAASATTIVVVPHDQG